MIMGPQSAVIPVALEPTANLETLHERIGEAISEVEQGQGVLVLLDLNGGTPSNATALHFQNAHMEAVAGVNLPMLLEVLCSRGEKSLGDLAAYAEEIGHQGVINVRKALFGPQLEAAQDEVSTGRR